MMHSTDITFVSPYFLPWKGLYEFRMKLNPYLENIGTTIRTNFAEIPFSLEQCKSRKDSGAAFKYSFFLTEEGDFEEAIIGAHQSIRIHSRLSDANKEYVLRMIHDEFCVVKDGFADIGEYEKDRLHQLLVEVANRADLYLNDRWVLSGIADEANSPAPSVRFSMHENGYYYFIHYLDGDVPYGTIDKMERQLERERIRTFLLK
jgi:hypothetical protein